MIPPPVYVLPPRTGVTCPCRSFKRRDTAGDSAGGAGLAPFASWPAATATCAPKANTARRILPTSRLLPVLPEGTHGLQGPGASEQASDADNSGLDGIPGRIDPAGGVKGVRVLP